MNIIILNINYEILKNVSFVDYHILLDLLEDNEEPSCDFGIFVSSKGDSDFQSENLIQFGDLVLSLNDEDLLESTAAQLKVLINNLDGKRNHQLTLGRKDS